MIAALTVLAASSQGQTVKVVNMIPKTSSGETNHDSEPNLAVNPANPLQLVGTAFTPDAMGTAGVAPIFVSSDGGNTWTLYSILTVPTSNNCVGNATCDITTRFAQTSGNLYLGWLTGDTSFNLPYNVGRLQPFPTPPGTPTTLITISGTISSFIDQPFTQATTALTGGNSGDDRVYIGDNDLRSGTGSKTASFHVSQAAQGAAPAGFGALQGIEVRTTCGQDAPPVRPAIHPTGVIYGAFYRWTAGCGSGTTVKTADVVVVRDDGWGSGSSPYQALKDSGDTLAGKRVVTGVSIPGCSNSTTVGNQRICGALSIAVDPNNNQNVWLVYAEGSTTGNYTLHVLSSQTGGASWGSDLLTVAQGINPALAITTQSKVGFLYQKHVSPGTCTGGTPCWETHFQTTTHGSSWTDTVLANTPDTLTTVINNELGDYEYLAAVGKNFYGIFSANNLPNSANFPQGVTYQRFADLTTAHALYSDMAHTTTVAASVDPFFFSVTNVPDGEDYYVRDWTDSPTSHDSGEEPSTSPVWWTTSDVWNRLTNTAGAFNANDQPPHQVAQDSTSGHNFAFVRVHRKAASSGTASEQVSASFVFADYGLGVPYEYVTGSPLSSTAALTFAPADTVQVLADGSGVQWDLPPERSTHVCMAVEIAGPSDPYSPELVGRAPGWPTDLLITTDNNKAQINMDLPPLGQSGSQLSFYGIAHNAALFRRDMTVRYEVPAEVLRHLKGSTIAVTGGRTVPLGAQGTLKLSGMKPGESRWIGVTFAAGSAPKGTLLPVSLREMEGPNVINAFTIAPHVAGLEEVILANLKEHRAGFARLKAAFHVEGATEESRSAGELLKKETVTAAEYLEFLKKHAKEMGQLPSRLGRGTAKDPFGTQALLGSMEKAVTAGNAANAANAHASFLNSLDAWQSMVQKSEGDPADFLQMVEWQISLYSGKKKLRGSKAAKQVLEESKEFVAAVEQTKAGLDEYAHLLAKLQREFHSTAEELEGVLPRLEEKVEALRKALEQENLRKVEGRHRELLLALDQLPNK